VFIYHLAADQIYGETAKSILKKIERGEQAITPR